jgi:chemotaxis protein CheY-P-specific phosphatase CheC
LIYLTLTRRINYYFLLVLTMNKATKIVNSDDILLKLCGSVVDVLSLTTDSQVSHAAMVQSITRTCLKPDLGCFSIFDGGFSGLVVINFSSEAALEIYRGYMTHMGMPEEELAISHTSDEVSDIMGELMNQILGDFISKVSKKLQTSINQSQPKMLTINKQLMISVDTNLDDAVARRVSFRTQNNHIFYLEFAMDKTEFIQLNEFDEEDDFDADDLLDQHRSKGDESAISSRTKAAKVDNSNAADDLLDELGI